MPENNPGRFDPNDPRFEPPYLFTHRPPPQQPRPLVERIAPNHRRLAIILAAVIGVIVLAAIVAYSDDSSGSTYTPPAPTTPEDKFLAVADEYGFDSGREGVNWRSGMLSWGYDICDDLELYGGNTTSVARMMEQQNDMYGNGSLTLPGVTALVEAADIYLCASYR